MAMITRNHYFTVDMDKPLIRQACGMLLAEGDTNGDCIYFTMMRNGHELSVSDATATAYFIRQDGNTVLFSGVCASNQVRVTLPQSCYNKEGCFSLAVKVVQDGVTATIAVLDGYIKRTNTDSMIDPEETIPSVDAIIAKIEELERVTEEAKEAANAVNTVTAQVEQNTSDIKALQQQDETFVEGFMTVANNFSELSNRITALEENGGGSGTGGGTGEDGFSPIVTVTEITGGHRVTIQDAVQTQSFDVMDGEDGADGVGIAKIEQTTTSNADNGINIMTITMTDGKTYTFQVKNGSQGSAGSGESGGTGADGEDGVGIASVVQTTTSTADGGTNVITVTLTDGSESIFNVKNGSKGSDGVSPVITVTNISGGHRVTIKDATQTQSFDVMDGEDGSAASVTIDDTLSVSGAAADAKETGDRITTFAETFAAAVENLQNQDTNFDTRITAVEEAQLNATASKNLWNYETTEIGQLTTEGTVDTSATDYVSTDYIAVEPGESIYFYHLFYGELYTTTNSTGRASMLCNYSASKTFISPRLYGEEISNPYTVPDGVYYIRHGAAYGHFSNTNYQLGIFKEEITTAEEFDTYREGTTNSGTTTVVATSTLDGKTGLIVGDSLSAANQWQQQLVEKGATYTNHALGGISLLTMIDGNDSIEPLSTDEVADKDFIILFGGTNDMRVAHGDISTIKDTEAVITSKNLMDYNSVVTGQLSADGTVNTSATDYVSTGYISFTEGEQLYVYYLYYGNLNASVPSSGNAANLCLYDANKNFISRTMGADITLPYTIPAGVAYIRYGFATGHFTDSNRQFGIFKQEITSAEEFDTYTEEVVVATATVAGRVQHAIDTIYSLLAQVDNLACRLMVVTPYCFGASDYNEDAFAMDGAGLAQTIEDVANYNGVPVYNAYKNSGINPTTLAVWGNSDSDHVHLNAAGYAHLGRRIARFVEENVME